MLIKQLFNRLVLCLLEKPRRLIIWFSGKHSRSVRGQPVRLFNIPTMVDLNGNTLRDVMKADTSVGDSGASNCWARQMKNAFGELLWLSKVYAFG
jgi:hypothetical protein